MTYIHILIILMEIIAFSLSFRKVGWQLFIYYTELSNLVTLFSSVAYLLTKGNVATFRYLSTVMLSMTFLITLFVLVPMGGSFKELMLSNNGLYHHTLVPILSVTSYILWESHSHAWLFPVLVTMIYGLTMMGLNVLDKLDGPYPFLRVRHQSTKASVLWFFALILIIAAISLIVSYLAR